MRWAVRLKGEGKRRGGETKEKEGNEKSRRDDECLIFSFFS